MFYDQIANFRASKKKMVEDIKVKVEDIKREAQKANELYNSRIEAYKKENKDLQAQLGVLRKRIENVERERDEL
jgi:prefoldin subunit 5